MVCLLDAHRDHAPNIRFETPFETTPAISSDVYLDTFGNSVRRFIAPPGDLTVCRDAIIEDSGRPDPVKLDAEEIPVERLPNETLVFTLGSRYCETDKLSDIAWQLFGSTPRGWRRVQAICDFVCNHLSDNHSRAALNSRDLPPRVMSPITITTSGEHARIA
jgi:transglutaminase-like putative cysteine protease